MTAVHEQAIAGLIQRKPGVNGGRPCLAGTGFSVHQLSVLYNEGASAAEIVERYPQSDLPRVHAAIAYYLLNRAWIDAEIEEESRAYWAEVARRKRASS